MAKTRVLGVLAGRDVAVETLRDWALSATIVLAADGGSERLLEAGVAPHVVVGDMDSSTERARSAAAEIIVDTDPDLSDCDKLLAEIARRGYVGATLVGMEGDRLDHVLASLSSCAKSALNLRIVLRAGYGIVCRAGSYSFELPIGTVFSLLPITRCEAVDLHGVKWRVDAQAMDSDGLVSLSNETTEEKVSVRIESGVALAVASHTSLVEGTFWDD